jgi:hypothetical protein
MRYNEILRFQMEVKQLHAKYKLAGLEDDELLGAAQEELTNLRDGTPMTVEEQVARAEEYQRAYDERNK